MDVGGKDCILLKMDLCIYIHSVQAIRSADVPQHRFPGFRQNFKGFCTFPYIWRSFGVRSRKMAQDGAKMGPKMAPRWSKKVQRWLQEDVKMAQTSLCSYRF